jgi:hypothetical protein
MLTGVNTVARVTVILWIREVARVLHTTRRHVALGIVASTVLAGALGAMLAIVAASQVTADIPHELRATILRTSFSGSVLSAGAIAVALSLSAPQRTALQNLLDLLPISRGAARLGQLLPILIVGFVYSVALSSTGLVVISRAALTTAEAAVGMTACFILIAVALLLAVSLFSLLQSATALIRLPAQYGAAVAGLLTLGTVLSLTVPDIFASAPAGPGQNLPADLFPHRAFAGAVASPSVLGWTLVIAWIVAAVASAWAAAVGYRPEAKPHRYRLLRGTRPLARTPFWGDLWMESLIAIRNQQYVLVVCIIPVAIGAVWMASLDSSTAIVATSLAGSLTVLPFMLALYAVGRTARFQWIATMATARRRLHVTPKAVTYFGVALVLAVPTAMAFVALGLLPPDALGSTMLRWVVATFVALVAGTLVPYSEQQPLSATAGGFILAVTYLLVSLGTGWLGQTIGAVGEVSLTIATIACFACGYVVLNSRQRRSDAAYR